MQPYIGMVTSDWSECLSPSGPFDVMIFHHPHLRDPMEQIFRAYTGNDMTLDQAMRRIGALLPAPIGPEEMDAYLESEYAVYADVAALRQWCRDNRILFMINSTGAIGYFQRVFARGRLAPPEALAANPMIRFASGARDPDIILPVVTTDDKPLHSAAVAERFHIPLRRVVVIGDSGGDGPHFAWGARHGATLVASLAKSSLLDYCRRGNIEIHHHWNPGPAGSAGNPARERVSRDLDGLIRAIRQALEPGAG